MQYTKFLRFAILGLFSVTLLVPFLVADGSFLPNMFFPYITGKNFAFRILVELIALFYIILALREPKYRPRMSWLLWALVGFVGWMALATIFSVDPSKSFWSNFERMEGYVGLIHMFVYALIAGAVMSAEEWWLTFFKISVVASATQGIYAFMQVTHILGLSPSSQSGARADGTFGNATYLAVYMLFNIFITLFLLVRERRSQSAQVLYGLALVLQIAGIYYTSTRGALLGLLLGLIVAALWVVWRAQGEKWRMLRKWSLGALAAAVVLVAVFVAARNTSVVQHSSTLSRLASISLNDKTTEARFLIWRMAGQGVAEHPVLGWGQENFNFVFNKYYAPAMYDQEQWFDRAHNAFVDWLIAGGIPAFLLYIALFIIAGWYVFRSELEVPEQAAILGLLCAYAFNNLFVFDNLVSYLYFFLVIAFVHGLSQRKPHGFIFLSKPMSDHGVAVVAPFAIVFAGLFFWIVNVPGLARAQGLLDAIITVTPVQTVEGVRGAPKDPKENLAQFKLMLGETAWPGTPLGKQETMEQMFQFASNNIAPSASVSPDLKAQFYAATHDGGVALLATRQHDARLELFMGTFLNSFGQSKEALQYFTQALSDSPKKQQILMETGIAELRNGQGEQALVHVKQAFEEATSYSGARILYAAVLFYAGKGTEADALLKEGFGTVLVDDQRLLQVYNDTKQRDRVLGIWLLREEKSPDDAQNHLGVASAYFAMGNKTQTIAELQRAAELNPSLAAQILSTITQIKDGTLKPQ